MSDFECNRTLKYNIIKIRSWVLDGCLTPRQTGRLTSGHNITLNLAMQFRDIQLRWSAGSELRAAVAEVRDSSGTHRKGNVHCWKPLPSSSVKTVTENTSLCVTMICKV
jgi:hypothetical protein